MKKIDTRILLLAATLIVALGMSYFTWSYAYATNGGNGFPLDDPWIHLQFAKNLHDYGTFSYFRDQVVTSGSTAPLYTLLLTVGFFLTSNEFVLSYVLGIFFLLASGVVFFRLARRYLNDDLLLAVIATATFLLEPRLQWVALSGMETTLFIFFLLLTLYAYVEQKRWLLGVAAGLLVWVRPEAVIFLGVLAIDVGYRWWIERPAAQEGGVSGESGGRKWILSSVGVLAVLGAGYAVFNLILSGTILPNTYAAKLAYYAKGGRNFPLQVLEFVAGRNNLVLAPFMLAGIGAVLWGVIRRRRTALLVAFLWTFGLFLAYWWKLPYLYHNGRYMMPVLPFVVLLGFAGLQMVLGWVRRRYEATPVVPIIMQTLLVTIIAVQQLSASWIERAWYQDGCQYIHDRQIQTAFWIRDHLPKDAVVATHDVGALAFYSGRRIVDMVGLISPEMIRNIGNTAAMEQYLDSQHVTHLAVLRDWFEIVNVNPIFQTDERFPEIMEVFAYDKTRMHFVNRVASELTEQGRLHLMGGDVLGAGKMLERAVMADTLSSRARFLLGWAYLIYGNTIRAEQQYERAVTLNPEYWDAYNAMAEIALNQNRIAEGEKQLRGLLKKNPKYAPAYRTLAEIYETVIPDTAKADYYRTKYEELKPRTRKGMF